MSVPNLVPWSLEQLLLARDCGGANEWVSCIIMQRLVPITYSVEISNGQIVKCHIDQLKHRVKATIPLELSLEILQFWIISTTLLRMQFRSHRTWIRLQCDTTPNVSIALLIGYNMTVTH